MESFSVYNYDYSAQLEYHFKPKKGWVNDPNGLVYFNGYYHLFYQHCPDTEYPFREQHMHWGHARSKDFINWEEMPVALCPDAPYDNEGCWSGTAIVKDDTLYLFYASVTTPEGADRRVESVSVAYSKDGVNFTKYEGNPVIKGYPEDGFPDFRDPAVTFYNGKYYLVMATGSGTGDIEPKVARLLIYESDDLLNWNYGGIASEWEDSIYAECPSIMPTEDGKVLLSCSVVPTDWKHFFYAMYGTLDNLKFKPQIKGSYDRGPDQYAGQVFRDALGRNLHITWIPGWYLKLPRCAGTWSVPREIFVKNGKVCGYPVKEVRHLLKDSDENVKITEDGFEILRTDREKVVHKGKINNLKILRDGYILEVFVNGGEDVYSVLL